MISLSILKKSPLFSGIDTKDLQSMLSCLSAVEKKYAKNELILRQGDPVGYMGLVLSGRIHILKDDFWGNRTILSDVTPSQMFAESFACSQNQGLSVSVLAVEPTSVLFLDIKRILNTCSSACVFHTRLIRNLLSVLAEKNLMLTGKIDHITKRTTREKLLSYLSAESLKAGSPKFQIPFNRQQLAEYLAVDRSAMSQELSKLQKEDYLSYHKNNFHLKDNFTH
ncbi:Crp/Fnr family transcriptional regulator [Anaerotignum sp. MB30-C6]|uniref:Crp/Fnr family transcriptional regulator n=1 Tax=Anaerotignum sp. MB30-C6 TaxID=3070814 RepID=UPI0027DC4EF6|nr:Crp/Fnr family transcriptional regulator [Anaerotignum sp. MB30-C6]WMI80329.1 Crp/Fnr family transcriptional regulator [Anaerotignum sp. MB30-C6]